MIETKISVDISEIDVAMKKLEAMSELLDKVKGQIDALSGSKTVTTNYKVASDIDPEVIKEIIRDHDLNCRLIKFENLITKSTLR